MRSVICLLIPLIFISSNIFTQSFDLVWETDAVLKTPESVFYDAERKQIYVSNINGKPTDKDGNGFISLLGKDGTIKSLKWIRGMHAPKGMAVIENLLYVTDIDRFHIIDLDEVRIISTIDVNDAQFLNDIAADHSGNVYISDMHNNHILKYNGEKTEVWLENKLINRPNGLAFYKDHLYIGTNDSLIRIEPKEKKMKVVVEETGAIDGLIPIGGNKFVISDWNGRISIISQLEKFVLSNTSDQNIQAADLGYIEEEKTILIPTFFDNKVVARKLH